MQFMPYTLLLSGIFVTILLYPLLGDVMERSAPWWLAFMTLFLLGVFVLRQKGRLLGTLLYRILVALGLAGIVMACFVLGYRETTGFYEEVSIKEPWVRGTIFRGRVTSIRGRMGDYYELIALLESIGYVKKQEVCQILYTEAPSLRLGRRVAVKIKGTPHELQNVHTTFTLGSTLILSPYYYLSSQTITNQSYQRYLYHKKRVGTIYVRGDNIYVLNHNRGFALPLQIEYYVETKIKRYVRKQVLRDVFMSWVSARSDTSALRLSAERTRAVSLEHQEQPSTLGDPTTQTLEHEFTADPTIREAEDSAFSLSLSLLTGDRKWLAQSVLENFRYTGTYHVLAISGMHTGLIIMIFYSLLKMLPLRRLPARGMVIFLLLPVYLMLVGPRVSVVRSVLMVGMSFFWVLRDQRVPLELVWAQILILMLLVNPHYAYDISFQLSFSAVLGVILAIKLMRAYRIRGWIVATWIVSISCQLFTMPFVFYYFETVNTLAPFYNILIPPLVMGVLVGSLFLILLPLSSFSGLLGAGLAYLNEGIFDLLEVMVTLDPGWLLKFPYFLGLPKNHWTLISLFFLILGTFIVMIRLPSMFRQNRLAVKTSEF